MSSDPHQRLDGIYAEAVAELGEETGSSLSDSIAHLTAELDALQERLRAERGRLQGLESKSHALYERLAALTGIPAETLWQRLSQLMEAYGTYRPNELARLRSALPTLLRVAPGAPIVCHGSNILHPGDGWYGTRLAESPQLKWNGRQWGALLRGQPEAEYSRFRHTVPFSLILELGLDSALRRDAVLVGTRLIRGYVGEFKVTPGFRADVDKIRRALLYAGLDTVTIGEILG